MLIENAGRAWRLLTVQVAAVAVVWGSLPVDMQTTILAAIGIDAARIPAILGLLFMAARLIKQPGAINGGRDANDQ